MDFIVWALGLLVLVWAVVLPFSIGTTLGAAHPSLKIVMRLISLIMLVGLIVWQMNPSVRLPLFAAMVLGNFFVGGYGTSVHKKDEGLSGSSASSLKGLGGANSAPGGSSCATCRKALQEIAGGVFDAAQMVSQVTHSPYPCKSCGTPFCIDCMNALRNKGGTCPNCRGAVGW
jgi:hypothetical protein